MTNAEQTLKPAIIQHVTTGQVLMLGYMNAEALAKTKETGLVTFYSRSKQRLWQKGETSGHVLQFVSMDVDCDHDAYLIQAQPQGPTCHTGSQSCFANTKLPFLFELDALLADRKIKLPDDSYTAALFKAGRDKILSKVSEESAEVVNAVLTETPQRLTEESADVLFHLMALLQQQGLSLGSVVAELQRRTP